MTLKQAISHHSNAVVLDADEPYYRRVFSQMLSALQGVSDRVEGADLGTAYVRIDGLEKLYFGEAGVVSALLNAAPAYLMSPRGSCPQPSSPPLSRPGPVALMERSGYQRTWGTFLAPHSIDFLSIPQSS